MRPHVLESLGARLGDFGPVTRCAVLGVAFYDFARSEELYEESLRVKVFHQKQLE